MYTLVRLHIDRGSRFITLFVFRLNLAVPSSSLIIMFGAAEFRLMQYTSQGSVYRCALAMGVRGHNVTLIY